MPETTTTQSKVLGWTKEEIRDTIKTMLGAPTIDVFTDDSSIDKIIDRSFSVFAADVYKRVEKTFKASQSLQLDPKEVVLVYAVTPELAMDSSVKDVYDYNEFYLQELQMLFGSSYQLDMQTPVAYMSIRNQMQAVFGRKFDFDYNNDSGLLLIQSNISGENKITVHYKSYYQSLEEIPKYTSNWVLEYALALTKQVEGRIRSKYADSIPGAPSDGSTLVNEGKEEESTLKSKLRTMEAYDIGMRW